MHVRRHSACLAIAVASACAMLGGCLSGRGSVDGEVLDPGQGDTPVASAFVVLQRSRGLFLSEGGSACDDEQLVQTDSQGRFHFDRWSPPLKSAWDAIFPSDYRLALTVYKRGYAGEWIAVDDRYRGVVHLTSGSPTPAEELQQIRAIGDYIAAACGNADRYLTAIKPLGDALREAAGSVAATPREYYDATNSMTPMSAGDRIAILRKIEPPREIKVVIHPPPTPSQAADPSAGNP